MAPISRLTGYKACILLEQLQEGAYIFQFIGINDLENIVQDFRERARQQFQGYGLSEYLIFQHVPYNTFLQLIDNESSATFHCRSLYIHDSQILRLKITNGATHETAAGTFVRILDGKFTEMQLDEVVDSHASQTMQMGNISKEPDGSWGPVSKDYVTLILEMGASESEHHVDLDAYIWIESEGSHVSQAITIKVAHGQADIIIQLWEARTIRQLRSIRYQRAFKAQEVHISLIDNVPTASGCLQLSFEKIFERPPRPGTSEGDIIFTTDNLTYIAKRVWRRQNLIPLEMVIAG
jgi:hypothetical protein